MLPIVLGGIALSATVYGLKKYIEKNDKYDEMEEIGFKIIDAIDIAEEKTDNFFQTLIKTIDELGENESVESEKKLNTLDNIYKLKEKFYYETMPKLLETFSHIKDLPDFEMEQFYKLQQKFEKEDVEFNSLDEKTRQALKDCLHVLEIGIGELEVHLDFQIENTQTLETLDYNRLPINEQEEIANIYLLASAIIEICYIRTIDEDNQLTKGLRRKILFLEKLAKVHF